VLVIAASAALFWRLDGAPLWRDEATTAVWARLMAESGDLLPYVYDQRKEQLLVQAEDGHDVNAHLLPAMQSYSQFYVAAASFSAFGVNEWTARAPFALFGALALFALYGLGRRMFGAGVWAMAPPALAITSIAFLSAVRQCRYYALVVFGACWLLWEVYRYLERPERAGHWTFYARLAAAGFWIYFANYLSFLGCWISLGLFVLLTKDVKLIRGFLILCIVMTAPLAGEFFALHAKFAANWPPPLPQPLAEVYQTALAMRMRDLWRALPLVFLFPAGLLLCRRCGALPDWAQPAAMAAGALPLIGFGAYAYHFAALPGPVFWAAAAVCATVPLTFFACWRSLPNPGPRAQVALLAGLILTISPLIVVALGKQRGFMRHYYQVLPAGIVLSALAAERLAQRNRAAGAAVLAGMAIWPNLDLMTGGADEVVQRQFMRDRSYNGPLIDFLRDHLQPGDRLAFMRNVKGMAMYFYFPEMRWVGLLDDSAPHNQQFRGRFPDDQFDSTAQADWYVFWEPGDMAAKGFDRDRYELVWKYSHDVLFGPWDPGAKAVRHYEVWKRRTDPQGPD
jgi:hypothetical protein